MKETVTTKQKTKQLLHILIPILITQVAYFSMNFFDTTMSGHAGETDLAGVAIGSSLWVPVFTGITGILTAITPIVSHLYGAKKQADVRISVIQALYLSLFLAGFVFIGGSLLLSPILSSMSLETDVRRIALQYLIALSFGIFPLFVTYVLRGFIDALGKTRTTMVITLTSLPINILLNYLLIFGKAGFPKLGGVGAGYATAITYWVICLITLFIVIKQKPFSTYAIFATLPQISFSKWKEILKIGVPIGLAIFFETSIFSAVTLLMSKFDTMTIAAHQAALNFSSLLYMVPLSISFSLTIVVGFEVGARRLKDAKIYSWLGVFIATLLAFVTCSVLLVFRESVAGLYSTSDSVITLTAQFLIYAIGFQFFDAIMAPVQGALRGYKDVNAPFIITFCAFWLIGLPLGTYLSTFSSFGAFGYWIGLIIGLGIGAIGLTTRLIYLQKKKQPALT